MRSLQAFQRLSSALGAAAPTTMAAALLGAGGCRLRSLSTSLSAQQGKPEAAMPDALDQEFDRGEDAAMAAVHEREWEAQCAERAKLAGVLADLECEYDRDDPDAVDLKEVWEVKAAAPPPEVDLDTEFDRDDPMMADKSHLWDAPEPPRPADISGEMDLMADAEDVVRAGRDDFEGPGGSMAGNTAPLGQGGPGSRHPPGGAPDPRAGQFREGGA